MLFILLQLIFVFISDFFFQLPAEAYAALSLGSQMLVMSPIFALSTGRAPTGGLRWLQFILSLVVISVC